MLIPMDRRVLEYLVECDGSAPVHAIPLRLFRGEMTDGVPNMEELGLIEHIGDGVIAITEFGRSQLEKTK